MLQVGLHAGHTCFDALAVMRLYYTRLLMSSDDVSDVGIVTTDCSNFRVIIYCALGFTPLFKTEKQRVRVTV